MQMCAFSPLLSKSYEYVCENVIACLSYYILQIPDSMVKIYQKRKIIFNQINTQHYVYSEPLLLDSSNHSMGSLLNQDNHSQDCLRSYFCTDEHISNCTKKPQVTNIFIEKRFSSYLIIIVKNSFLWLRQTCQIFHRYICLIYHPILLSRKTTYMFYLLYNPCHSFQVIYTLNTSPLRY